MEARSPDTMASLHESFSSDGVSTAPSASIWAFTRAKVDDTVRSSPSASPGRVSEHPSTAEAVSSGSEFVPSREAKESTKDLRLPRTPSVAPPTADSADAPMASSCEPVVRR